MEYTQDWLTKNSKDSFDFLLTPEHLLLDKDLHYLEIGTFEGRSLNYVFDNFNIKRATVVDPLRSDETYGRFMHNTIENQHRIVHHPSTFREASKRELGDFDLIYVDGSHWPYDCLYDLVNAFDLLKTDRYLVVDDYEYTEYAGVTVPDQPKIAIDAFIKCYKGKIEVLRWGWALVLRKLENCV